MPASCGDEQRQGSPPFETLAWQTTTFTVKMIIKPLFDVVSNVYTGAFVNAKAL